MRLASVLASSLVAAACANTDLKGGAAAPAGAKGDGGKSSHASPSGKDGDARDDHDGRDRTTSGAGKSDEGGKDDGDLSDGPDAGADQTSGKKDGGAVDTAAGQVDLSQVLVEDGGELSIPGVKAQRVGVNFEDTMSFDRDYNDAVLCFTGAFKVNGNEIVSYKNQTVKAELSNSSACTHRIEITIVHPDGTQQVVPPQTHTTYQQTIPLDLAFKIKSRLYVKVTKVGVAVEKYADLCADGLANQTIPHENPDWFKIGIDLCNPK